MSGNWQPIASAPVDVLVMTKIDDHQGVRNEQTMRRQGNLWFAGEMYVYYQPTHWRELTMIEKLKIKNEAEARAIRQLEAATTGLGL